MAQRWIVCCRFELNDYRKTVMGVNELFNKTLFSLMNNTCNNFCSPKNTHTHTHISTLMEMAPPIITSQSLDVQNDRPPDSRFHGLCPGGRENRSQSLGCCKSTQPMQTKIREQRNHLVFFWIQKLWESFPLLWSMYIANTKFILQWPDS